MHSLKITSLHYLYKVLSYVRERGPGRKVSDFMESRGPDEFWAAASAPNTADRHLLERPVGKDVGESGSAAVSCRRDLRDGGSLHSEKPPLTQAFCSVRPAPVRVAFRPSVTSPTLACPTDCELHKDMNHFIFAHISSLSSGKATDAFYGPKTMFP